ncbi:hypothetical protein GCM10017576_15870 [Microbacterium barkeri]|uniref:DUF4194 domain-containing protein n=1 Tax=Microbacterium barkeri TaxID=33917 RepID=A0A9W6H393_9MICO|nr:DUF4194 domain-containing protein [Microbacterium barkeri]MDI6943451.1 DUF4194 domain-containing protein [Microbacterium barkeri]MDR6878157.1 hypothetical protein [Microbacterium barkeri]GLJ61458.1 hypothetical protein GCM10017576_15870 [Microbacterium barkeri]
MTEEAEARQDGLWRGDEGALKLESRKALLKLIQGPYLSASRSPRQWAALLSDEATVRSRLNDLFLDLVVDRDGGFAFVRNVDAGELDVPSAVRSESLTFLDTAMLLVLRQLLLSAESEGRVIVGQDEVFEQLEPFRTADRDETDFRKRLNASWVKMKNRLRVVHTVSEDRVEISPVLRLLVDAEQARAIAAEYARIRAGERTPDRDAEEAADDDA